MPGQKITPAGMEQGELVKLLADLVTNFNAVLTKLDADGGVTDTNYNALYAIAASRISGTQPT